MNDREPESDRERIVRLETKQESQTLWNEEVINRLDSIDASLAKMLGWMQNKTGFVAGAIFAFSIVGAVLGAIWTTVWNKVSGH